MVKQADLDSLDTHYYFVQMLPAGAAQMPEIGEDMSVVAHVVSI